MRVLLLLVLFFVSLATKSQDIFRDTTFVGAARAYAVSLYEKAGIQSRLISGSEYVEYLPSGDENPTLLEDCQEGTVFYDGDLYERVFMLYDLTSDRVAIENWGNHLQLNSKKVSYFTIGGRTFVKLSINNREGFYELLHDGATRVLCRREKTKQEHIEDTEIRYSFDLRIYYLIVKDGLYFRVRDRKDVLAVFADHRGEVRKFMNDKRVDLKGEPAKGLVQISEFYDQLAKNP